MTLVNTQGHGIYEYSEQVHCLIEQGFTSGLARLVIQHSKSFALRIWIIDNSGSMNAADGKKLIATKKRTDVRWVTCTRFAELQECVLYHAQLSALLEAPTRFTLLNAPSDGLSQDMGVAELGRDMVDEEILSLTNTLQKVYPRGVTPLTNHIHAIYDTIQGIEASLYQEGKKVVVVVATDGLPTDATGLTTQTIRNDFENALKRLQQLPVWIVVRLCTDEASVLAYYENLDRQLELSLEVLDDFEGEAKEIFFHNPWLTYSLVLHRCREMGFSHRLLDLLDERQLTVEEMLTFVRFLLSGDVTLPDPHTDWATFKAQLQILVKGEEKQYNPIKQMVLPWIDFRELERTYGPTTFFGQYRNLAVVVFGVIIALLIKHLYISKDS